jgi:hypothetical protein
MPVIPNKNPLNPVVTIGIILFGLIAGYVYYSQIAGKGSPVQAFVAPTADTLTKFKDLGLNFTILDNPQFKALQVFGESPVEPGETGRVDIFNQ